jgi:hypothetical protein
VQQRRRRGIRFADGTFKTSHQVRVRRKIKQSLVSMPRLLHRLMRRLQLLALRPKLVLNAHVRLADSAQCHFEWRERLDQTTKRPTRLRQRLLMSRDHFENAHAIRQRPPARFICIAKRAFLCPFKIKPHCLRVLLRKMVACAIHILTSRRRFAVLTARPRLFLPHVAC